MSYEKQNFIDGQCLCGHHLNHIEDGIVEIEKALENGGYVPGGGGSGEPGKDGEDGFSPVVEVTEIPGGHIVSILDAKGLQTFIVADGEPGKDGDPGKDGEPGKNGTNGISPVVTVEEIPGGHRVTVNDINGETYFDVMDGTAGQGKTVSAVDLSGYESSGTITETYSDGSSLTYNFDFDSEGKPIKITDSDGNETVLTW